MSGEPFRIPGLGQHPDANTAIAPDVAVAAQYALADLKKLAEIGVKDDTIDTVNEATGTETAPIEQNGETTAIAQDGANVEKDNEAVSSVTPTDAANTDEAAEVVAANGAIQSESVVKPTDEANTIQPTENIVAQINGDCAPAAESNNQGATNTAMEIDIQSTSSESETTGQATEAVTTETDGQGPPGGDIISTLDAALALEDVSQEVEAEHPEWEVDSSPYESSSEDSGDSSDDDSDDSDHPMLGIEETVRLLMAEDDHDGDGNGPSREGRGHVPLRTKNETAEEPLPKPDVTITPKMKIELIGHVASVVETTVVIESLKGGETRVLNIGSVLCKVDRTVVGALADTFGPVKEPRYLVFFDKPEEIKDLELENGTPIYYSVAHADYVFTEGLKQEKGTDASNLFDEEVHPDAMEFSDDEKEAAFKMAKKMGGKGGRGRAQKSTTAVQQSEVKHDSDEDGPYKPLIRPEVFAQGVPSSLPPRPPPVGYTEARPSNWSGGAHRGRGPRGGHRGGHRGGRGGHGGHGGHGGSSSYEDVQAAPRPFPMAQPPPTGHGFVPPPPPGWTGQPAFPTLPLPAQYSPPPHGHQHQVPPAPFNFGFQGWNQGQPAVPPPPAPAPAPASGYSQGWQAPASGSGPSAAYGHPAYYQGNAHNQQTPGQGQGQPPAYWPHGQPPT